MATVGKPQNLVAQLYQTVIEDVINNVRESFLDDGVDEQVLQELKQIWESKLNQTKAVDSPTLGERHRPAAYTYLPPTKSGQPVIYQAIPAQTVQLSSTSQQARMAIPDVMYQQRGSIVLPTQNQQVLTSYQPVRVVQQPDTQQVRRTGGSGQSVVFASASHPGVAQQQNNGKPSSSNVIQVDGCADDAACVVTRAQLCSYAPSPSAFKNLHMSKAKKSESCLILQLDGHGDSSSSDDDIEGENDEDEDGEDDEEDDEETQEDEEKGDEEPLNSGDDDSDQDASELFDTDNVVVCQYDKIHRAKAKWKFNLKVGIMNLEGKDHVFQKANGEADW